MTIKTTLLAFILFFNQYVSAAEVVAPTVVPEAVAPKAEIAPVKPSDLTSEENRKYNKYQIIAGFLGREYVGSPITLGVGYYINPKTLINLRYSVFNGTDGDTAAQKLRAVTLGLRLYMGNSFNIMPTAYYRRNTADYYKEGSFFFTGVNNLVYEDVGVGFRIGNEWQWESFTMGCDWFGINKTVKELNKTERGLGIIDDISLQKSLTITVLSFYLGYSF